MPKRKSTEIERDPLPQPVPPGANIWVVFDERGAPIYSAAAESACEKYIKDALVDGWFDQDVDQWTHREFAPVIA